MDELKKITDQIEYLFINKIIMGLRDGSLDLSTAKESAAKFLQIEPFISFDDAKAKVYDFTAQYSFLPELKNYIDGYHEELKKHEVIQKMRSYMKEGAIDQALQVAKE